VTEAYIYEAIRTPRGKGKPSGALHGVKPISLVTGLVDELRRRLPALDVNRIDDLILGINSPVWDQGGVLPRTAALAAGLPYTVAGMQLNRYCASGLEAVNTAAEKVRSGWEQLVLAGGVESMSRIPMGSSGSALSHDPESSLSNSYIPQGVSADLIATLDGFSRDDVDSYAVESQQRAAKAWRNGYFARSVVPVQDRNGLIILDHDEHMRPDTTLADLAKLPASFAATGGSGYDDVALQRYHWLERIDHVHHAGNSSGIVDGASLTLIGSPAVGDELGLRPRARIVAGAVTGEEPTIMLTGPAPASRRALDKAGLTVGDIDLFELNEAFASVVLHYMRVLDVPHEKINVNGGAIAMGHPLGATGAMIVGTLLDELERRELRYGLVTLCVGGGMGIATVIERLG
jgi:acetyl-CoA C-acetyltransferase